MLFVVHKIRKMSLIHNHYNHNSSVKPKHDEIHITHNSVFFKGYQDNYYIVI